MSNFSASTTHTKIAATLSCCLFTLVTSYVQADSSLTLYGSAVDGIAHLNSGKTSTTKLRSGGSWSNYVGLAGRSDIAPATSALFNISQTYDINTGDHLPAESYFGVAHQTLGAVHIGKMYDFTADLVPLSIVSSNTLYAFHPGGYDRAYGATLDHSLAYLSPVINNVQFKVLYSPAEQPAGGGKKGKDSRSVELRYSNEQLSAALIHTSVGGGAIVPGLEAGMSNFLGQSLGADRSAVISLKKKDIFAAAVNYRSGNIIYRGVFTQIDFFADDSNKTDSIKNVEASAAYHLTPDILINLGHTYSYSGDKKWNTTSLSADYAFNDRFDVMAGFNYQHTSGPGQVASLFAAGNATGPTQTAFYIGARYLFDFTLSK